MNKIQKDIHHQYATDIYVFSPLRKCFPFTVRKLKAETPEDKISALKKFLNTASQEIKPQKNISFYPGKLKN